MKTNTVELPVQTESVTLDPIAAPETVTTAEHDVASQTSTPLVDVANLNIWFADRHGTRRQVVHNVDLKIHPGECVAIIGESGSGKSVTARTLIGLTGEKAHIETDSADVFGRDIATLVDRDWKKLRGNQIGDTRQVALVALDLLRTVGSEIGEALRAHGAPRAGLRETVEALLAEVGVPEPALRARQRPDQLSGGLRQRALIASAIANDPPLIIADEPTNALDVKVHAEVIDVQAERQRDGTAILLISHDFSVVSRLATKIFVMKGGQIVETGNTDEILRAPQHPYTQELLGALPSGRTRGQYLTSQARDRAKNRPDQPAVASHHQQTAASGPIISAQGLTKRYRTPDGGHHTAVDDVSFELEAGQVLGIVGESGSGKSTTGSIILGLSTPDSGQVLFDGKPWSALPEHQRRAQRRQITAVYQDPLSSFDPRWSAERVLVDALDATKRPGLFAGRKARSRYHASLREQAVYWADIVGLAPQHLAKHPLQLSGGQRQRLAIARALAPNPQVVVMDEAASALDVSVQAQVLDLLTDLRKTLHTAFIFISHDLGVIHHLSDQILVLKDGQTVEYGHAEEVFNQPEHAYTQRLIASVGAYAL